MLQFHIGNIGLFFLLHHKPTNNQSKEGCNIRSPTNSEQFKKRKKKKKSIFTTYPADLKKEFSQITEVCVSVNSGLNYIEFDIKNKLAGLIDSGELQQLFFFLKFDIFFFF